MSGFDLRPFLIGDAIPGRVPVPSPVVGCLPEDALECEPQALGRWATDAGLSDIASVYLAQRNGFQIQVRLFGRT